MITACRDFRLAGAALAACVCLWTGRARAEPPATACDSGAELYGAACAACHGAGGKGAPPGMVGFDTALPDFTDCNFVTREAAADWSVVVSEGGPARGFSEIMPAFGDALTQEQILAIVAHLGTFADCDSWPRGELNLPRPLVTTKAFPEDELVLSTSVTTDGPDKVANKLVYERRIGDRNQVELVLPFGWNTVERGGGREWTSSVGDVALAAKRVLFHGMRTGSIVSGACEVVLPTGDEDEGFGDGTTVFEPFVLYGQLLPGECFFQGQAGAKLPAESGRVEREAFWRGVFGRTFGLGRYESSWSPMVEILGARGLEGREDARWDIVPQLQVSLNRRQHVRLGVGARIPLNHTDARTPVYMVYLMWDTFDGGFFDGW